MLFDDVYRFRGCTSAFKHHTIVDTCICELRDADVHQVCMPYNDKFYLRMTCFIGMSLMDMQQFAKDIRSTDALPRSRIKMGTSFSLVPSKKK